jgi:dipeptidyl aminopeptidase/acylaminoacyl peptidase
MQLRRRCRRAVAGTLVVLAAGTLGAPTAPAPAQAQTPPACPVATPCRLTAGLPEARALNVEVTPDGTRAVFLHTSDDAGQELYSVPVAGGAAPTKLDVPAATGIGRFAISPDSTRVLYTSSLAPDGGLALFSVPITGPAGATVRLANDLRPDFQVSADSRKVVLTTRNGDRVRAVPIGGPANAGVRLTDPFAANGVVFELSDNSSSVVYSAAGDTAGVTELYRVPLTLTPPADPVTTKLSGPLVANGDVQDFEVAAGGGPAVYRADQDTDNVFELYSVRLGGAGRVKLSVPLPAGWDVFGGGTLGGLDFGWQLLPDGSRAVYEVQSAAGVSRQLLSVPTAGPAGASVRLDSPPTGSIEFGYRVAADSSRVVYAEGTTSGDVLHLGKSVPAAGPAGAGAIVTWPTPTGELFTISPDGDHVVWELGDTGVLFRTASTGPIGDSVRLNGDEDPNLPQIDPASRRVTYLANQPGPQRDLFSAPIGGDGTRYNLTAALDAAFIPSSYRLTPTHAVYPATPDFDGFHLYSSRLVPT